MSNWSEEEQLDHSPLYDTREEQELDDELAGVGKFERQSGHTHVCLCGTTWEHDTMLSRSDCEEMFISNCPACEGARPEDYPTYREQEGRF